MNSNNYIQLYLEQCSRNLQTIRNAPVNEQGKVGAEAEYLVWAPSFYDDLRDGKPLLERQQRFVEANNTVLQTLVDAHNAAVDAADPETIARLGVPKVTIKPAAYDPAYLREVAKRYRAAAENISGNETPNKELVDSMLEGAALLEAIAEDKITPLVTDPDRWHWDNPLLLEAVQEACQTPEDIDFLATLMRTTLNAAQARLDALGEGIKILNLAALPVYDHDGATRFPILQAFNPMLAVRHSGFPAYFNPNLENDDSIVSDAVKTIEAFATASMSNAGGHTTTGPQKADDIPRLYRVLAAFSPVFIALTANAPIGPNGYAHHSARTLQGGWLGAHPEQGSPRMGFIQELLQAELSHDDFNRIYLEKIMASPAIVDFDLDAQGNLMVLPVQSPPTPGWPKTAAAVIDDLLASEKFQQLSEDKQQEIAFQCIDKQLKIWGPARARLELLRQIPVTLMENRLADSVPPEHQALLQKLMLALTDPDNLRHAEIFAQDNLGLPRDGATPEEIKRFEDNLRITGINTADSQGLGATYASGMTVGQAMGWLNWMSGVDLQPVRTHNLYKGRVTTENFADMVQHFGIGQQVR